MRGLSTFPHQAEKAAHSVHVTMHTKILIVPSTEIQQELSDDEVHLLSLAFSQDTASIERYIGKRKKSVIEN